jgi:hypothetical protein
MNISPYFGVLEAAIPKEKEPTIRAAKLNVQGNAGSWQSASTGAFAMRDGGKEMRDER